MIEFIFPCSISFLEVQLPSGQIWSKELQVASKNDFIKFNVIALKSANETKYWLCLIRDTLETDKVQLEKFINEANEISKIIAAIVINTKKVK